MILDSAAGTQYTEYMELSATHMHTAEALASKPWFEGPGSTLPLYSQLRQRIVNLIEGGQYPVGGLLPSEAALALLSGLSLITVRRALKELVADGYVRRIQGKGTYVARPSIRRSMTKLLSFTEEMRSLGYKPGSQLLGFGLAQAPTGFAADLGITETTKLLRIERLRFIDREPISITTSYLLLPPDTQLTRAEVQQNVSLYVLLERKGIFPAEADKTLQATAATERQARLLKIKKGTPLLLLHGIAYTVDGKAFEYSAAFHRADVYRYRLTLRR